MNEKASRFNTTSVALISLIAIILTALFVHMMILLQHGMFSDEAVYTYTAYAISEGVVPYKEIYLAQPPLMYYVLVAFINVLGNQIVLLRLVNILTFLGTAVELFVLSNLLLRNASSRWRVFISLLSTAIYALYPSYFLFIHIEVPLDNMLSFFALTSALVYVFAYQSGSKKLLLLSGIFLGLTALDSLRGLFFVVPILLFHLVDGLWRRRGKALFLELGTMVLGIAVPVAVAALYLFVFLGTFHQFYMQNVFFQSVRPASPLDSRIGEISIYVGFILPLLLMSTLGTIHCVKRAIAEKGTPFLLLPVAYFFSFFALIIFTNTTMKHYFYFLTPYLVFLSCMSIPLMVKYLFGTARLKAFIMIFFVLLGASCQITLTSSYSHTLPWFTQELADYMDVNYYVGKYVANVTEPTDKIWTSEGAIAFFAERVIAAPNSTDFPFHAFFEFELVFASNYTETNQFDTGATQVASTLRQFEESWEYSEVKSLVFIKGDGWLTYPDNLLWNGFDEQQGVSEYVHRNYELQCILTSDRIPYIYEIWIRQ